jgi:hypothetical protein
MKGTLHDKPMYIYDVSLNSSYNGKCFRQRCRENQNIHLILNNFNMKCFKAGSKLVKVALRVPCPTVTS